MERTGLWYMHWEPQTNFWQSTIWWFETYQKDQTVDQYKERFGWNILNLTGLIGRWSHGILVSDVSGAETKIHLTYTSFCNKLCIIAILIFEIIFIVSSFDVVTQSETNFKYCVEIYYIFLYETCFCICPFLVEVTESKFNSFHKNSFSGFSKCGIFFQFHSLTNLKAKLRPLNGSTEITGDEKKYTSLKLSQLSP